MRHSIPLALLFLPTILFAQEAAKTGEKPLPNDRLAIGSTRGATGGRLESEQVRVDGSRALHGLQVAHDAELRIKEYSVYNLGRCEQLVQFYRNGNVFRSQHRDHNGDGDETIYTPQNDKVVADKVIVDGGQNIGPIKVQDALCFGRVKGGKYFSGTFLVRELRGFQFELMLNEYAEGKLVSTKPFPLEKLELDKAEASEENWRWSWPDWPQSR
jgi:hypothetical protein